MGSGHLPNANPHQGCANPEPEKAQHPERQPASAAWRRTAFKRAVAKVKEPVTGMFARAAVPFALLVALIHAANYTTRRFGGQTDEQDH